MVPGGLPHASASPRGQGRRVAPRHGQGSGARVDGPGAAVGWRPKLHPWCAGVAHKSPDIDRLRRIAPPYNFPIGRVTGAGARLCTYVGFHGRPI